VSHDVPRAFNAIFVLLFLGAYAGRIRARAHRPVSHPLGNTMKSKTPATPSEETAGVAPFATRSLGVPRSARTAQ
jgi:hypothetical protein